MSGGRQEHATHDAPLVPDLVYDVGMHLGEDSAYYLKKGFRVVGFEASPNLVEACRRRFAEEIVQGRLTIVAGAISDTSGETTTFYEHTVSTTWGTIDSAFAERNASYGGIRTSEVRTVRFADHLRETGMPYYLKVDIEGADRLCFEALRDFSARPSFVSLESAGDDFNALLEELDLLRSLGYDRFAAVQQEFIERRPIATHDLAGRPLTHTFEANASGPFGDDLDGRWEDHAAIVERYRRIYRLYRLVGDHSLLYRVRVTRRLLTELATRTGTPLAGWYDTHACRAL